MKAQGALTERLATLRSLKNIVFSLFGVRQTFFLRGASGAPEKKIPIRRARI